MANEAKNILHVDVKTKKNDVNNFFKSIEGVMEHNGEKYDLIIDFQKIVPVSINYEDPCACQEARFAAWGTKCCYTIGREKLDDNTIEFTTAWQGVPQLMQELSRQHPKIKLFFICEMSGTGINDEIGAYIFQGGEMLHEAYYENNPPLMNQNFSGQCIRQLFFNDIEI